MPLTVAKPSFATLLDRYGPPPGTVRDWTSPDSRVAGFSSADSSAAIELITEPPISPRPVSPRPVSPRPVSLPVAEAHCRSLASGHYENFPVLSVVVPRPLRQHFANVYAFCRWADDLGDEVLGTADSQRLLAWWQEELNACYRGEAWHPVFVALQPTIAEFQIPQQPFDALISAFQQDQVCSEYESFEQLHDYCRRSADPVGRLVLYLCRQTTPENCRLSDNVCTGLQLINFWQDVARDAMIGRTYLPKADRVRFGYDDAQLARRESTAEFVSLMQFEVERARSLLTAGLPLADRMPGRLKLVISLFALGGLRTCDRVAAIDYRVWEQRPKLGKADLPLLFGQAAFRAATAWRRRK